MKKSLSGLLISMATLGQVSAATEFSIADLKRKPAAIRIQEFSQLRAAIDAAYGAAIPKIDNTVPTDQIARLVLLRGMAQRAVGN